MTVRCGREDRRALAAWRALRGWRGQPAWLLLLPAWLLALAGTWTPSAAMSASTLWFEVESGAVWQGRNDVAVPNETGTRFALDAITSSGPYLASRLSVGWRPGARHELRGLFAPLEVSGTGAFDRPVLFDGATFEPGVSTNGTYRFDSYRLTYRYLLHGGERWEWRAGVTAKLRSAEVTLVQGDLHRTYDDLGVVPLLHLAVIWKFSEYGRLRLDADAAAASQGRAVDAAIRLERRLAQRVHVGAGYRVLEGGADVSETYAFGLFHYAVLSLAVGL
ncbi:MAG: hypothetical protein R6X25_16580 [Candidatus Krumholzibacteriia bacterium]